MDLHTILTSATCLAHGVLTTPATPQDKILPLGGKVLRDNRHFSSKFSFLLKLLSVVGSVISADMIMTSGRVGAALGILALAWLGVTMVLRLAVFRHHLAVVAVGIAGVCGTVLFDHFTLVGCISFWAAINTAAISPRTGPLAHAGDWSRRLSIHVWASLNGPAADLTRLKRLQSRPGHLRALLLGAVLPIGGGLVFLLLFARANPIIGQALQAIRLPDLSFALFWRAAFWLLVGMAVWATLRPGRRPKSLRASPDRRSSRPWLFGVSTGSVISALAVFNALFALENGLDLAFLWSDAPLPHGVTLAEYAHRGAYPLIFTALLAAGFSLLLLRKGSPTAANPLVRWLVGVWVGQNVLLSASSLLRTADYVQAYSLTRFRIAALLWMGLVTLGLALIGWRMARNKSAAWLINANALALAIVLVFVSVSDLGAIAAWWNVRHARDLGGHGVDLDVCYFEWLGSSALLPLLDVEAQSRSPLLRARAALVRRQNMEALAKAQADWRSWTWRGARRLQAARDASARIAASERDLPAVAWCDGDFAAPLIRPVAPSAVASTALTPGGKL